MVALCYWHRGLAVTLAILVVMSMVVVVVVVRVLALAAGCRQAIAVGRCRGLIRPSAVVSRR